MIDLKVFEVKRRKKKLNSYRIRIQLNRFIAR